MFHTYYLFRDDLVPAMNGSSKHNKDKKGSKDSNDTNDTNDSKIDSNISNINSNNENENENKKNEKTDPFAKVVEQNPLLDLDDIQSKDEKKDEHVALNYKIQSSSTSSKRSSLKSNSNSNSNNNNKITDPILVIEEALAELKLVKDALLGNLDETQLEAWLDWNFIETEDSEPPLYGTGLPPVKHRSPKDKESPNSHRRNISSSGLLPPQQAMRAAQSTSALKKKSKSPSIGPL